MTKQNTLPYLRESVLSGLLRPLIQRRWAAMVAQLNRLEECQLKMFLFGANRTVTGNTGQIVLPPAAGLFSAFGLLEADLEKHLVQTFGGRLDEIDCATLDAAYARMEQSARAAIGAALGALQSWPRG